MLTVLYLCITYIQCIDMCYQCLQCYVLKHKSVLALAKALLFAKAVYLFTHQWYDQKHREKALPGLQHT